MPKHRIFVAIDIPGELKKTARTLLENFQMDVPIKKTKEENMHITVVFCGNLTDEELWKLERSAEKIANRTQKIQLTPKRIVFAPPSADIKQMVWMTFKHSPEFVSLSEKFTGFAEKNMKKPFPHATLVRFNNLHYPNLKKLIPIEGIGLENKTHPFLVERINVMETITSHGGAQYKRLKTFKLV